MTVMAMKTKGGTLELDRLNALLVWWGVPNSNETEYIDGQMKRFQVFASNLQKAYGGEYCRQMEALFMSNQRLVLSLQEFLRCGQPQEVIAVELSIWVTVLEGVSQQAKAWTDLTQKVQNCCTALASKELVDIHKEAQAGIGD